MAPATRQRSALLFLLAFALGGIAVPIGHQVDHFLDGIDAPVHHEASVLPASDATLHDCALCDVKLAADHVQHESEGFSTVRAMAPAVDYDRMLEVGIRTFDGRAPPALS